MRRDFSLENGIYCEGLSNDFKLYYNEIELTPSCSNIAYIPKTLIAIKAEKTVYVYEPKIIDVWGYPLLRELARFEPKTPNVYLMVSAHQKTYVIDQNVQISISSRNKI